MKRPVAVTILCMLCLQASRAAETVLVEAEGFDDVGGWSIDQQFTDQMGSPFLLAHGMGRAVTDAVTRVRFGQTGAYRVWVRTWNWNSPWNAENPPGRFRLAVNGKPLDTVFGTRGQSWHWQPGGSVRIDTHEVTLALKDLTGFEGRCDAIVFSSDSDFVPPDAAGDLLAWRRRQLGLSQIVPDAGQYDLVVVGGGLAGTCAAVSAARLGAHVALIQNRPVLGGNNSSEVRVSARGHINLPPYPALGNLVYEIAASKPGNADPAAGYEDQRKLQVVQAESNVDLFLNTHADEVEVKAQRIVAVLATDIRTGRRLRFPAKFFADCTGDATLGFKAGADYRMGRESHAETGESLAPETGDAMTMGASIMWYSRDMGQPTAFPECPWALQFTEDTAQFTRRADWDWETGMDLDQVDEFERVRDRGLRAVYGNWAFLKNHPSTQISFETLELDWVAYVGGKRESRRLLGDVILQQQAIDEALEYPDAAVTTTWTIDLHYPEATNLKQFPDHAFRSIAKHHRIVPYPIPYRCFYSRNIKNLFMAGRNISVTHVALGTVRVMQTTGMMGEVVGMAASLCTQHNCLPRDVYASHLDELILLMTEGVGETPPALDDPPQWLDRAGKNLALKAVVAASSTYDTKGTYPAHRINDGIVDTSTNATRWVSDKEPPHTVSLTWESPQRINAIRLLTGQISGTRLSTPITSFVVQTYDGQHWQDVPGTRTTDNDRFDCHLRFGEVTTTQLRLFMEERPGQLARLWEWECYRLPEEPQAVTPVGFAAPPRNGFADAWEVVTQVVDTPGWHLWGASPVVDDTGRVNLLIARWPAQVGWEPGWRKHSEIALYRSDRPEGPFTYQAMILQGDGTGWDAVGMHNPCVARVGKQYVLFHIANSWVGGLKRHGPNQRIGLRLADSLEGPWRKGPNDGLALAPGTWCTDSACGVNNPAFVRAPDGRYLLYFKAMPGPDRNKGVRMGVAVAETLAGPYVIHPEPITANNRTIEDGTAFLWGDKICLITTDNHGIVERGGGLLWTSDDGIHFAAEPLHAFHPLRRYLPEGVPERARMHYGRETKFERPQMLTRDDRPAFLYLPSGTSLDGDAGTDVHLLRLK